MLGIIAMHSSSSHRHPEVEQEADTLRQLEHHFEQISQDFSQQVRIILQRAILDLRPKSKPTCSKHSVFPHSRR